MRDLFVRMAAYNAWANARLYDACARLRRAEYRAPRAVAFGSIHGTLNHLMVGDLLWLARLEGSPVPALALDQVLYDDLADLRAARACLDARLIGFTAMLDEARLAGDLSYHSSQGLPFTNAIATVLQHVFNHQTHHRGQLHAMLSATAVPPPPMDLIYYDRERGEHAGYGQLRPASPPATGHPGVELEDAYTAQSGRPVAPAYELDAMPGGGTGQASVLVIVGVSGSGKTTIAAMLAARLGWTFEDGDWFHSPENVAKMAAGTPLDDADRWPWLTAIADWIDATIAAGRHGVVACSALKRRYRAVLAGAHGEAVRIVFLDGSHELIGGRMALRHGHFMPPALLDSQFSALEVPGPDEHGLSVSIEPRPREVVETILTALAADIPGLVPAGPARPSTVSFRGS